MLNYQQWKLLNESFAGASFNLGVKTPQAIAAVGSRFADWDTEESLEETKKKMKNVMKKAMGKMSKKKMHSDDDEMPDELVKAASPKDDPDMDYEDDDKEDMDYEDDDDDDEDGGCPHCNKKSKKKMKKMKKSKKMCGDHDDEEDMGDEDMGDDEDDDEDDDYEDDDEDDDMGD